MRSRQIEILLYLLDVKKATYRDLEERFEISRQTAIRDINVLSSMGVPVYTKAGRDGGIFIPSEYKLNQTFFTPEEIASLVFALHLSGSIHVEKLENSILHKLETLIPNLVFLKKRNYQERVKVDLLAQPIHTNPDIWHVIDESLDKKKWILITIKNTEYLVYPLNYLITHDGLFLQCTTGCMNYTFSVKDMQSCLLSEPPNAEKPSEAAEPPCPSVCLRP